MGTIKVFAVPAISISLFIKQLLSAKCDGHWGCSYEQDIFLCHWIHNLWGKREVDSNHKWDEWQKREVEIASVGETNRMMKESCSGCVI